MSDDNHEASAAAEHSHDHEPRPEQIIAWLEAGGFIAAADGLSQQERDSLAASASSSTLPATECARILDRGASYGTLPDALKEALRAGDKMLRLQILSNVFQGVASDGVSGPEWSRFCDVATVAFGAAHVDDVIRYCLAQSDALKHQARIVLSGD